MSHAFRIYKELKLLGFTEEQSVAVATIVERGGSADAEFLAERTLDSLFEAGFDESKSEAIGNVLRNCYPSEKFRTHFDGAALKFRLVRSKFSGAYADKFLAAIIPAVATHRDAFPRVAIKFAPGPGKIVMCDFNHLAKPEMVKERRAIIISNRNPSSSNRCVVVPVSMNGSNEGNKKYHKFEAGKYPFFHPKKSVWAICDHIYTVSLQRIWQVNVSGKPSIPHISESDLASVRQLVGHTLGGVY